MGCTPRIHGDTFIGTLVVLAMLTSPVRAGIYRCWGGCLNQCVLIADKKTEEKSPCYWDCLAKCFPPPSPPSRKIPATVVSGGLSSPASEIPGTSPQNNTPTTTKSNPKFHHISLGRKYYCIIGCSLHTCMRPGHGGTDLKICLIRCSHKCK